MAKLDNFDVEAEASEENFSLIPKGEYEAMIVKTEIRNTQAGTGAFVAITFAVLDEEFKDKTIISYFNIINPSEQAQKIGRGQLSALCKACGKTGIVDDTEEIHDTPLFIKVDTQEGKGINPKTGNKYGDSNVIRSYRRIEGSFRQPKPPQGQTGFEALPDHNGNVEEGYDPFNV